MIYIFCSSNSHYFFSQPGFQYFCILGFFCSPFYLVLQPFHDFCTLKSGFEIQIQSRVSTVLRCGYVFVYQFDSINSIHCEALHHHIVPRSEGSGSGCFWASAVSKQHRRLSNNCRPLGSCLYTHHVWLF